MTVTHRKYDEAGVSQLDIIESLRDRKWHKIMDLVQKLSPNILPERASKAFRQTRVRGNSAGSVDLDMQVALGCKILVEMRVNVLKAASRLQDRYEIDPSTLQTIREVRLTEWFCWSCGVRQVQLEGEGIKQHLCPGCMAEKPKLPQPSQPPQVEQPT